MLIEKVAAHRCVSVRRVAEKEAVSCVSAYIRPPLVYMRSRHFDKNGVMMYWWRVRAERLKRGLVARLW